MELQDQTLIQQMCEESPRFRKLHEEHILFEKKLNEFEDRVYLSAEDELERRTIQKLKLAGKDEMISMLKGLQEG